MNEYKSALTPEEVDAAFKNMANLENGIAAANSAAKLSQSWAVGGTGTREGEDTNNAQYWAQQAQKVAQGAQGWYETEESLRAAHPTGENGQWAIVGSTDTIWTWDSDTGAWVNTGSQMDLSGYYTKEQSDERFATAAQGKKADTAVQSVNGAKPGSGGAVTIPVGTKWTLMWTNPAPSRPFEAQTVSVDLSEYDAVVVTFCGIRTTKENTFSVFCKKGETAGMLGFYTSSGDSQFVFRTGAVSGSGVTFSNGAYLGTFGRPTTPGDGFDVPKEIYGIKL